MIDSGNYLNLMMSLLLSKVIVPSEFHEQAVIVEQMISKDTTGLVDSLTQFKADCATVDIVVDSESDKLDEIINEKWLPNINSEYRGQGIEVGLRGLMKEYHKEVWRGASFPVLKILKWKEIDGIWFPTSMTFVDGGSVYAKDKNKGDKVDLFSYDYFLGKTTEEKIKGEAYFMYKPFVRWHAKYPVPYLIRRGVYKNWKIVDMIKDKEIELVDRIIPYMMLVMKGTEQLALNNITYSAPDLEAIKVKIQEMMDKLNQVSLSDDGHATAKAPTRVTNFDEEIKHLIPDLEAMFKRELFAQAEKNILAGLGFIDIADAISTSRRESVLNPKVFIKECNTGVSDFKIILKDILELVKEKNESNIKYNAKKWIIASNPITDFATDSFKELIRSLGDRGFLSNDTTVTICGENSINYELEKRKRIQETKDGDEIIMYPKLIQNQEEKGTDIQGQKPAAPAGDKIKKVPEDRKKGTPESKNWNQATLEDDDESTILELAKLIDQGLVDLIGSPYTKIAELPPAVRKRLDIEGQRKWMAIWNSAYKFYLKKSEDAKQAETMAFKTAWAKTRSNTLFSILGNLFKAK